MSKFASQLNTTVPVPRPRTPRTLAAAAAAVTPPRVSKLATRIVPQSMPVVVAPHHHAQPDTVNEAGGRAFRKSAAFELVSLVFCALLNRKAPKFYESDATTIARMQKLVSGDPFFAAQVAVWARRVLGLRSITHALTAAICYYTKGQGHPWVKTFVESVIFRPDDAIETVAAYFAFYGKGKSIRKPHGKRGKRVPTTLPYPLKKGIACALSKLDGYKLAKYKKEGNNISLVDLFNLTHPRPKPEHASTVKAFMKGELKNVDTWEARLSAAGSDRLKKEEVWCSLFDERKLGYLAALKNARNILEQAPGAVDALVAFLTNPKAVAKSLVLPFQFVKAYKEISSINTPAGHRVARAIEQAVELSIGNIPVLPGRTLVCLDESGSMGSKEGEDSPAGIGSLFTGIILKSQPDADFLAFSSKAHYERMDTSKPLFSLVGDIRTRWHPGGTNFHTIFDTADKAYDNIIILSDGEGWGLGNTWEKEMGAPTSARRRYEQNHGKLPFLVTFDLSGASSAMFPENSVAVLAGFSDKVLTLLNYLKKDPQALVNEVRKVDFDAIVEAED